jgi:hypothetical protein
LQRLGPDSATGKSPGYGKREEEIHDHASTQRQKQKNSETTEFSIRHDDLKVKANRCLNKRFSLLSYELIWKGWLGSCFAGSKYEQRTLTWQRRRRSAGTQRQGSQAWSASKFFGQKRFCFAGSTKRRYSRSHQSFASRGPSSVGAEASR